MAELVDWDTTAANNNDAPPNGAPEGMSLPSVNDTMREMMAVVARWIADNNGSLTAGGTASALTLTTNGSYTSLVNGLSFVFKANATNTGATTLQINAISAASLVNRDGTALTGSDFNAGEYVHVVYDLANTRFVLVNVANKLDVAQVSAGRVSATSTNAPDLTDAVTSITAGPAASAHLEIGPADIQAKADTTTAAGLELNQFGGDVNVGPQTGTGTTSIYHDGARQIRTQVHNSTGNASGAQIRAHDGAFYDVGFAGLPVITDNTASITLDDIHVGAYLRAGSGGGTINFPSSLPTGARGIIAGIGTKFLSPGAGVSLTRFPEAGSVAVTTNPATLGSGGDGIFYWVKTGANDYDIWSATGRF